MILDQYPLSTSDRVNPITVAQKSCRLVSAPSLRSPPSHHRSALLQDVHGGDEHVLVWTLEQEAEQRDASGVADGLLVLGAFTAALQR